MMDIFSYLTEYVCFVISWKMLDRWWMLVEMVTSEYLTLQSQICCTELKCKENHYVWQPVDSCLKCIRMVKAVIALECRVLFLICYLWIWFYKSWGQKWHFSIDIHLKLMDLSAIKLVRLQHCWHLFSGRHRNSMRLRYPFGYCAIL